MAQVTSSTLDALSSLQRRFEVMWFVLLCLACERCLAARTFQDTDGGVQSLQSSVWHKDENESCMLVNSTS